MLALLLGSAVLLREGIADADPRQFVAAETPSSVWPFERLVNRPSRRMVFVHYFPPMPLSLDNAAAKDDLWSQYQTRKGAGGKFADRGGYVRQRPLPRPSWAEEDWRGYDALIDVLRAKEMGADGFGVDIIGKTNNDFWQQADRICRAASATPGFYFVPEIDGASYAKYTVDDVVVATKHFAQCPAAYRLPDGKLLILPFAPDIQGHEFWRAVEEKLAASGVSVSLVPDLLNFGKSASDFASISDCLSAWGDRDPDAIDSGSMKKMTAKTSYLGRCWMQPVAPQDARPKSSIFWEAANTELLRRLWMEAITSKADYVHMITWNDYGEATEFEPSSGSQFLFYDLSAFYIQWFKTGRKPKILRDAIYYSHRTQIFDPERVLSPGDKPFKLMGSTPLTNDIEMVAMLTEPAKLEIELAGRHASTNAPAGLQVLRLRARPGKPVFRILRGGKTVVEKVSDWTIEETPMTSNPDYFGGSSTRPFQQSSQ